MISTFEEQQRMERLASARLLLNEIVNEVRGEYVDKAYIIRCTSGILNMANLSHVSESLINKIMQVIADSSLGLVSSGNSTCWPE